MNDIYWIGPRDADIKNEDMFTGSITRYGYDSIDNVSFCNNKYTDDYNLFLKTELEKIICNNKNSYFIFANDVKAYQLGQQIFSHSICLNSLPVIECLNNKIFIRDFLSDCVTIPQCIAMNARSAKNTSFVESVFNYKYRDYVIQVPMSAGGEKTFFQRVFEKVTINDEVMVLITPYIENAIPINVHIAISNNDYRILPPSVQIVLNKFSYVGSDYIKFQNIALENRNKMFDICKRIAYKISTLSFKGILGLDFLLKNDDIIFLECNCRYQGSSCALNYGLIENKFPSFFKLQYMSFYNNFNEIPKSIFYAPINFSSYRRTKNDFDVDLPQPFLIFDDSGDKNSALRNNYIRLELYKQSIYHQFQR